MLPYVVAELWSPQLLDGALVMMMSVVLFMRYQTGFIDCPVSLIRRTRQGFFAAMVSVTGRLVIRYLADLTVKQDELGNLCQRSDWNFCSTSIAIPKIDSCP